MLRVASLVSRSRVGGRGLQQIRHDYVHQISRTCTTATGLTATDDGKEQTEGKKGTQKRFFDSREKYLMFINTTDEKRKSGDRVLEELEHLNPSPPSINVFDAGLGDASVLTRVLRGMHGMYPSVPFVVVSKEISLEDVRLALSKMPDRFAEHPQLVICVTNMFYRDAPKLVPSQGFEDLEWIDMPLCGNSAIGFERQIERDLVPLVDDAWHVKTGKAGNPIPKKPAVLVVHRQDQRFTLDNIIPKLVRTRNDHMSVEQVPVGYDLVIACQPFRARASAKAKVKNVLLPMAHALKRQGRMVVIQSSGLDPGMSIVKTVWPEESPFNTPGHLLYEELTKAVAENDPSAHFELAKVDTFRYSLSYLPKSGSMSIGTSLLVAAWNAAVYVAQIDDARVDEAFSNGDGIKAVKEVLAKSGQLWFTDETIVIKRDASRLE